MVSVFKILPGLPQPEDHLHVFFASLRIVLSSGLTRHLVARVSRNRAAHQAVAALNVPTVRPAKAMGCGSPCQQPDGASGWSVLRGGGLQDVVLQQDGPCQKTGVWKLMPAVWLVGSGMFSRSRVQCPQNHRPGHDFVIGSLRVLFYSSASRSWSDHGLPLDGIFDRWGSRFGAPLQWFQWMAPAPQDLW